MVISEVLLRVGPILALAVLNALIIHKFLKIARKRQALKGNLFLFLSSNQYMACKGFCQLGVKRGKADLENFFIQEDSDNALIPYIL